MTGAALEATRKALRTSGPSAVVGMRECAWLDAKEQVYALGQPKAPEELAKDVASFANTQTGGLILVGYSTRREFDHEIIDALKPVPRRVVNLDQYRKIITTRVIPALRDVSLEWIDCGNEAGVLVIDIPAQPRSNQPFMVPAPTRTEQISKEAAGVPIRQGDATVWLSPHDIQRYVALGWANSDNNTESQTTAAAPVARGDDQPKNEIGAGEPGWKGPFQQAWDELNAQGLWLGTPSTDVYRVGPGVVQHFETPTELFGWVLCARPRERPVAVAGAVWQALQDEGSGTPDGDALGALGFPTGEATKTHVVGLDADVVELAGGKWGAGQLRRTHNVSTLHWQWEPTARPDTNMSAASRNWTTTSSPPQLRLRVLAVLPWADTDDLVITPGRRQEFVQLRLPTSPLAGIATTLSRRRGGDLPTVEWRQGPNQNANDRLSYSYVINSPDGNPALAAEVMMAIPPSATGAQVVTCAEIRVEDFTAWAQALNVDSTHADLRLTIEDLEEFFIAAWTTATEWLPPVAMDEPTRTRRWRAAPRIELWIANDDEWATWDGPQLIRAFVDLTAFGDSDRTDHLTEMMIAVPALPTLEPDVRRRMAHQALIDMAQRFGFVTVADDSF